MSSVIYNLNHRGVRLIDSQTAWVVGKNGKRRLNPQYQFVGRLEASLPNVIITATDNKKPTYRGDTSQLNATAKKQIVSHFFNENGKRNKKRVAFFGIDKKGGGKK